MCCLNMLSSHSDSSWCEFPSCLWGRYRHRPNITTAWSLRWQKLLLEAWPQRWQPIRNWSPNFTNISNMITIRMKCAHAHQLKSSLVI